MEVDGQADVKNELPTPPASDVGSPTSFSQCGSDSEPDSPMGEDTKVCSCSLSSKRLIFCVIFVKWIGPCFIPANCGSLNPFLLVH